MRKVLVCCFGDSHANFFKNFDFCDGIYMGPQLAYTLSKRIDTIFYYLTDRMANKKADEIVALFCFGEIDIRVHLGEHKNISECVDKYFEVINKIISKGYRAIVFGPIGQTMLEQMSSPFPAIGSCFDRNKIASEFNSLLSKKCEVFKVPYISIFEQLIDENGLTKEEFYESDRVHLSKKLFLWLNQY